MAVVEYQDCLEGGGGGGGAIVVIGLYGVTVLFGDAIREAAEAVADEVVMSAEELRELFNRPSASEPENKPTPLPFPYNRQLPTPTPTCTPENKKFYFKDVGGFYDPVGYPIPGRDAAEIIADLEYYNVQGMEGAIGQIEAFQDIDWAQYNVLMGRKFEAERSIFFASRNALERMNVSSTDYDLIPIDFGPIRAIEVKWSNGPMPPSTITNVANQAQKHSSGTFLVESNNLNEASTILLKQRGGEELTYPYPSR